MWIVNIFSFQPVHEIWEIFRNFISYEDSVYHMAAEQSHFYFVSQMGFNASILMNCFKDMRSCGSIGEFELIKLFFCYVQAIAFLKILNIHVLDDILNLRVSVFKSKLRFQLFLF